LQHGVSLFRIGVTIIAGQKFRYFHSNICKTGYYLAIINLFVATNPITGQIYTAFYPGRKINYINSLKANGC
jgi:hypothetical protein